MIVLDATTKSLEVVLASPPATNQCPVVSSWQDITSGSTPTMVEGDLLTNGSTPATAVAAPAPSHQILLKSLSLFNNDTAAVTATVQMNNNGTRRTVFQAALQSKSALYYDDRSGWYTIDSNGNYLSAGNAVLPAVAGGRLTLTSGSPVTTADVTGGSIIYYSPYAGDKIALFANGAWGLVQFSETSLAIGTRTLNVGVDVFAYNNNGALALEQLEWTSGSVRATSLSLKNGVLVKSTDSTRRYLGSYYSLTTTTTEDSAAKRCLFNFNNRVPRKLKISDSTSSWTYTTASWRAMHNLTSNRIQFMIGWDDSDVTVNANITCNLVGNVNNGPGLCLDNTNADNSDWYYRGVNGTNNPATATSCVLGWAGNPGAGFHYLQLTEFGATTLTVWGSPAGSALTGVVMA